MDDSSSTDEEVFLEHLEPAYSENYDEIEDGGQEYKFTEDYGNVSESVNTTGHENGTTDESAVSYEELDASASSSTIACLVSGSPTNMTLNMNVKKLSIIGQNCATENTTKNYQEGISCDKSHVEKKYIRQGAKPKKRQKYPHLESEDPVDDENFLGQGKRNYLTEIINRISWQSASTAVTEEFKNANLNEPTIEVCPQIRRIKDFFGGGYEEVEDSKVIFKRSGLLRKFKKRVEKNQLRKEKGFFYPKIPESEEEITLPIMVKNLSSESKVQKKDVLAIVASAGSGKTTLLRRMVRETVKENKLYDGTDFSSTGKGRFDLIHYMELKSVGNQKSITPAKFLFDGLFKTQREVDEAYECLNGNRGRSILFFDGLDQATWDIKGENVRKIRPYQKSDSATIMCNLLTGDLLPGVKIVVTSREFTVSALPRRAQPNEIISLAGFTYDDAKVLFVSLVKEKGEESWNKISNFSKRLINLMSIPIFLLLAATVTARDPDKPPPTTITELFNRIMHCLGDIENIHEGKAIFEIIKKLKVLAHEGMEEGRVVFTEEDLQRNKLTMNDVRDLMMKIPGNSKLSYKVVEGENLFFFCHQSLQEYLSGSYICEMNLKRFSTFCYKHLLNDRWSVVCSFVSGIIHSVSAFKLHKIEDQTKKQEIFGKILISSFKKAKGYRLISILTAIYESDHSPLIACTSKKIDLGKTTINADGAHLLGCFMARTKITESINLKQCGVNDEIFRVMAKENENKGTHVETLNLKRNNFTMSGLNEFVKNVVVDVIVMQVDDAENLGPEEPDWDNLKHIDFNSRLSGNFTIQKHEEEIAIEHERFFATFQTKDKSLTLVPFVCNSIIPLIKIQEFLKPTSLTIRDKYAQCYLKPEEIYSLERKKFDGKIPNVLMDSMGSVNIDPLTIISFVSHYKVNELDFVMDLATKFSDESVMHEALTMMKENISKCGCYINIHFVIYNKTKKFGVIATNWDTEKSNWWEYMKFEKGCSILSNNILDLVRQSNLEKLTLLHARQEIIDATIRDIFNETKDLGVSVESRIIGASPKDAWYYVLK